MAISLIVMDCSCNFTIVHFSEIISVYFADVNNGDKSGKTPLHTAILSKQFRIVDRLLECGADVTITDDAGDTALHTAIHVGSEKLVLVSMRRQSHRTWFTSILVPRYCDLFRQQLNRTLCQYRKNLRALGKRNRLLVPQKSFSVLVTMRIFSRVWYGKGCIFDYCCNRFRKVQLFSIIDWFSFELKLIILKGNRKRKWVGKVALWTICSLGASRLSKWRGGSSPSRRHIGHREVHGEELEVVI